MQFTTITALAFAAMAYAAPVENTVEISLPPGCTKGDLTSKDLQSL